MGAETKSPVKTAKLMRAVFGVEKAVNEVIEGNKRVKKEVTIYKVLEMLIEKKKAGGVNAEGKPITEKDVQGQYNWNFCKKMVTEEDIRMSLMSKDTWLNVSLDSKGKVKGNPASLDRFNPSGNKSTRPFVVLSQLLNSDRKLIGYKVVDYRGVVTDISLKEMIALGVRISKTGGVPVQNLMFMSGDETKRPYFKVYPDYKIFSELKIRSNTNKNAVKPDRIPLAKNEQRLTKKDIFTREQLAVLADCKRKGLEVRIIGNPALSPEQMKELVKGLEKKVNVKLVASPDYTPQAMKSYINDMYEGIDIRGYLNPKYSLGQLSELSLAAEEGLDLSVIGDLNKTPSDMAEIRERMEAGVWGDHLVTKDGSWN